MGYHGLAQQAFGPALKELKKISKNKKFKLV
jgi:hypothetical protein